MYIKKYNLEDVKSIHDGSFEIPNDLVNPFQVMSEDNRIITAGGIKLIPEIVLITDKQSPVLDRKLALNVALDYMLHDAKELGFSNLHVFVNDQVWKHRLLRTGFKLATGDCLILGVD
jgi:hypothetical protein